MRRDLKAAYPQWFPYDLWPSPGGLLPFGNTTNGDVLYWRTRGTPNKWTVVIEGPSTHQFEEFPISTTAFLHALLSKSRQTPLFPEVWIKPVFRPDA